MENYDRIEKYGSSTCYYLNDKRHRLDGPACEWFNGRKEWWQNGKRHRIGGPAIEENGDKWWYQNDLLHRIDGPAIECSGGYKEWLLS